MTKDEVRTLIDGDEKLRFWAGVLFAEICETIQVREHFNYPTENIYAVIKMKVEEWERMVRNRMVAIAKGEVEKEASLAKRVEELEKHVKTLFKNVGISR